MLTQTYKNNTSMIFDLSKTESFVQELPLGPSNLPSWLVFSVFLFLIGLLGMIFNYKNFLITMLSVEITYLGLISSFVFHGVANQDARGSIYGLVLLVLAACESAIGLGILIVLYRFGRTIDFASYQELGG